MQKTRNTAKADLINMDKSDVFKSEGAQQVIRYIKKKYQDEPQFLWKKFPKNAVFKRQDNSKWYAILLVVQKEKLGLIGEDEVDIMNLRIKPEDISTLLDGKNYLPGFHMNKKHWITICFDSSSPTKEIFRRIDKSFEFAAK